MSEFSEEEYDDDESFADLDDVNVSDDDDDALELDYGDDDNEDNKSDESESDEDNETEDDGQRKPRRYNKNYSNVKCPYCRRIFYANRIRYTFIRGGIVYTCPICQTILSINNRSRRRRYFNRSESTEESDS